MSLAPPTPPIPGEDRMSTPTFTRVEPTHDVVREIALGLAIAFHEGVDEDDPHAVIETATEFLGFLRPNVKAPDVTPTSL